MRIKKVVSRRKGRTLKVKIVALLCFKTIVVMMILAALPSGRTFAETSETPESAAPRDSIAPRFEDIPVSEKFRGKPARVDLSSHPRARRFRTVLREGAAEGPNFAGHFTVVTWHCGSDCQEVAVVNARTGRVYFAPFTTSADSDFRLDSRLFIANPPDGILLHFGVESESPARSRLQSSYYEWKRDHFEPIYPKQATKE